MNAVHKQDMYEELIEEKIFFLTELTGEKQRLTRTQSAYA